MNQQAIITSKLQELKAAGKNQVRIVCYDVNANGYKMIVNVSEVSLKDDPTTYPILTKAGKISKRYVDRICVDCDEVEVTCIDR